MLKPGYKQTEVGIIPEDWSCAKIGEHAFVTKLAGFEYSLYFDYSKSGPIILIRALNIKKGRLILDDIHSISQEISDRLPRSKLKSGDLVISYVGTLGRVAVILEDNKFHLAPNVAKISLDKKAVIPEFLGYFLNSFQGQQLIFNAASSTTQAALSMKNLREIYFIFPILEEQRAIAEALSDADALIESLEQLIAKKRAIKQGAMQELLTGKRRLPGFDETNWKDSELGKIPRDWKIQTIGQIANVKTGPFGSALHERDYVDDGTPIITVEHLGELKIIHSNLPMVSPIDKKRLDSYILEEGDIVFSRVGSVDRNSHVTKKEHGWLFSGRILRLRALFKNIDTRFLSYYFHLESFKQRVRKVAVGQTMASLNTQILKSVQVVLPSKTEQTAIATILSDMDAEIGALEAKLTKAQQLKQAMMQELLTGKTRLVEVSVPN
jgi:type I restriction enzyme S subunit